MKTFLSFAKINLHLEVVRRRPDGFHELRTVFQTIDLADEIRIDRRQAAGVELVVAGADLPGDRRNLAYRAAEAFLGRWSAAGPGVRIELDKRIPVQSGLGGGSSNAAAVLLGLSRLQGLDPFAPALAMPLRELAAELGADVPFFLLSGTAIGEGRGELLTPLADSQVRPLTGSLWLALPPFGLATAEVFARVRPGGRADERPELRRALAGESVALEELIGENQLEPSAFALRPELAALYTCLARAGAKRVRMSGSGSALFALFDDLEAAGAVPRMLPSGTVWKRVRALGRAAWGRTAGFQASAGGQGG